MGRKGDGIQEIEGIKGIYFCMGNFLTAVKWPSLSDPGG
jgi:hypothetical protein